MNPQPSLPPTVANAEPPLRPPADTLPSGMATPSATDPDHTANFEVVGEATENFPAIPGYRINAEIARGGMGRVLAGVELALDREVAIKTLLPKADASRFVTEAMITARLPHPSIPPVYALGTLADGSPFLAMKLVRGQTLADQLKASPSGVANLPRFLQIFEQIAQAVGFAHAQGIIHRDLKPANVMVGAFGEVQVMDWGLAKVLRGKLPPSQPLLEKHPNDPETAVADAGDGPVLPATATGSGAILGTPSFMAPEQARGEPATPASDVFALGGLLCAILTGKPVFRGATVLETIKRAAAGDTAAACAQLETCGADREVIALAKQCLAAAAADRPADGQAVALQMATYRADVEARLKQAETEKAEALVREVEQRKRRRVALTLGGGILLVVLLGLAASLWQMNRAIAAERTAVAESDAKDLALKTAETNLGYARKGNEILGSVFTGLDPAANYQDIAEFRAAIKQNLQHAVAELDGAAIGDPLEVAAMQNTLGLSLFGMGEADLAIQVLEKARATRHAKLGPDHPDTLASVNNLAMGYQAAGKGDQALPLYEETLRLCKAKLGPDHSDTLASMNNLAGCYYDAGQLDLALPLLEETLRLRKAKQGPDHPDTLTSMRSLAFGYRAAGKRDQALPLFEETLRLMQAKLGHDHPDTLRSMNGLAFAFLDAGHLDQALNLLEETLRLSKAKLGPDHPSTLTSMNSLAGGYRAVGKLDQALPLYKETLRLRKAKLGPEHPDTLTSMNNLAGCYYDVGQLDQALPLYEETLRLTKAKLGPDHPDTLTSMNNLAAGYLAAGKLELALPLWEETLRLTKAKLGHDHPDTLTSMNNLAAGYLAAGKLELALPLWEETLRLTKAKLGPDHPDTLSTMGNLGKTYCDAKQGEKAAPLLKAFVAGQRKRIPSNDPRFAGLLAQLSLELLKCDQFATAEEMLREALAIREKTEPDAWATFNTMSMLGAACLGQKKYAEAEPLLLRCYEGIKTRLASPGSGIDTQNTTAQNLRLLQPLDRLIELYTALEKPDEVQKYQAERAKISPPTPE